jgi:hypothetical protein
LEHLFDRRGFIAKDAVTWVHRAKKFGGLGLNQQWNLEQRPIKSSTKTLIVATIAGDGDGGGAGGGHSGGAWEPEEAESDPQGELVSLGCPPGEDEVAEIDQQQEGRVSRHCLPAQELTRGPGGELREEQRESCHGEQTEVGGAEEAKRIDLPLGLVVLLHSLPGGHHREQRERADPGAWRTGGASVAESSATALTGSRPKWLGEAEEAEIDLPLIAVTDELVGWGATTGYIIIFE